MRRDKLMITDKELKISNKSYVNKDFATIYPELLDYVKILTNKWNPQTSNESDPGIVLLKLMGFIGDKLNYNVDKNVLENFALSCTQESSMRKNLAPLGYEMRYYHSADVPVQFTYTGDELPSTYDEGKYFVLPALETSISSDDGSVQFVLTEDVTLHVRNEAVSGNAIQGRKETLLVGGKDTILLEDIDANNRIYFPISMVAENGVFLHNVNSNEFWTKVDNLNVLSPGTRAFLFGYDSSRGLPYIEFPNDIASLIMGGLNIDYIITNGADGNVSAKTLTKVKSPSTVPLIGGQGNIKTASDDSEESPLLIKNISASINGANPETLDEAYNNFKKRIGTFDTLVTCRDYANYIYNMENEAKGGFEVSNVQVSDRRDDITFSTGVVSFDEYGQTVLNCRNQVNEDVNAYDLFLYPLNPISSYTVDAYNNSFTPVQSLNYIKRGLESSKCISHDYYDHRTNTYLYALKNKLKLKAQIATNKKVNSYERKDIVANVVYALIRDFNARKVEYGCEIPYNDLLKTMEGADERISSVNLLEPELTTKVMLNRPLDGTTTQEFDLISSDGLDYLLSLMAHNILMGKVTLFSYDDDFNYDFGQEKIAGSSMKLEGLKSISTQAVIELHSGNYETLLPNEVIQMVAPSLVTETTYSAYVYFCMEANGKNPGDLVASDGTNYKLKSGDFLWIWYKDAASNNVIVKKYSEGSIIQPSGFSLYATPAPGKSTQEKTFFYDGVQLTKGFESLAAKESLNIRKVNKTVIGSDTYFYWIRANANNSLFLDSEAIHSYPEDPSSTILGYEAMLGDGEYLFYTDSGFNSLVSLGSGTTIRYSGTFPSGVPTAPEVTYEEIEEEGLLSLRSKWKYINLTKDEDPVAGTSMTIQENAILTLTEGDRIKWTGSSGETITINNKPFQISGDIEYSFEDGSEAPALEKYDIGEEGQWTIRSRLDINTGKLKAQTLNVKAGHSQAIEFRNNYDVISLYHDGDTFNLNESYQFMGASNIDVTSKDIATGNTIYPFSVYCYKYQTVDNVAYIPPRSADGYCTVTLKSGSAFNHSLPAIGKPKILMIYVSLADGDTLTLQTDSKIRLYNSKDTWGPFVSGDAHVLISDSGMYCIEMDASSSSLLMKTTTANETSVTLDYIRYINADYQDGNHAEGYSKYGLNASFGLSNLPSSLGSLDALEQQLLQKIRYLDNHDEQGNPQPLFYYTNRIRNSNSIEWDDLTNPLALYDVNNVANKFTISQIEFSEDIYSDIDVMRSSRL